MAEYRKKPVVIQATQWHAGDPLLPGMEHGIIEGDTPGDPDGRPFIQTLEGCMRVDSFDWVITGVKGEVYPCKPDIFEMSYDKVIHAEGTCG